MSTTEQQLKRIQEKLRQLLKQYNAVQKENQKLKEELDAARQKITGHEQVADELKLQISVLKMNNGEMKEADKKELEKRLNAYLREIDRCIALLGE